MPSITVPFWTSRENHHCEKHGNTQISPNLTHKLWKMLAPGIPERSYQTKPGLPSGCQVNVNCFYAKSTCLGSNYRNISSLTLVQKVITWGQWIIIAELTCGLFPMISHMVCPSCWPLQPSKLGQIKISGTLTRSIYDKNLEKIWPLA
jgi:hypothetical protein